MARSCLISFKLSAFVYSQAVRDSCFGVKCVKFNNQLDRLRKFSTLSETKYNVLESQSSESDSDSENQKPNDSTNLKLQILKAALNFVPQHGWKKKSLALGANSLGLSSASHSLIQDGAADLVHCFNFLCNEKLESYLKDLHSSNEAKKDIRNYIEDALKYRLQMVIPYVITWPEAMALMISPSQFPVDLENLLDLVDMIWYHSGDQSLNLTWYSKRLSLAMAYKTCELSLLQDKSTDFSDTFSFLQRRVENVIDTNKFINEVVDKNKNLPEFASGALITIRNILGANRRFR